MKCSNTRNIYVISMVKASIEDFTISCVVYAASTFAVLYREVEAYFYYASAGRPPGTIIAI